MHLILLPGNSSKNKTWIQEVESDLGELFNSTYIHYYMHWEIGDGNSLMNFDMELERLAGVVKENPDYVIFAKSAGVILALRGICEGILSPKRCFFCRSCCDLG